MGGSATLTASLAKVEARMAAAAVAGSSRVAGGGAAGSGCKTRWGKALARLLKPGHKKQKFNVSCFTLSFKEVGKVATLS